MTRIAYALSLLCLCCGLVSCGGPKTGAGSTPSTSTVSIQNPQWAMGTGRPNSWSQTNDADVFVTIIVQTIDGGGNAVVYKRYDFNKAYSGTGDSWISQAVEVPSSGDHVIQVELNYSECTWQWTTCTGTNPAGKKKYARQTTYRSKQSTYTFSMSNANIVYENCGC